MRVRQKVNVTITDDLAGKDKLFALDDTLAEVILDGPQEMNAGRAVLAPDDVFTVPMGTVTDCRGVFLVMTADCSVAINGGAALACRLGVKAEEGGTEAAVSKFFFEGTVTSVVVTANADDDLVLKYAVWGDPAE